MNLLTFTVYNAGYHRLKDMNVVHDCFVGQFSLLHGHHQFLRGSVLDVGQRHFADVRRHPFNRRFVTCDCSWLDSSTPAAMEHTAIFNRLNPQPGLLAEVVESIDCAMSTVELMPSFSIISFNLRFASLFVLHSPN